MGFVGVPQGSGKCFVMVEVDVVNTTVFVIRVRAVGRWSSQRRRGLGCCVRAAVERRGFCTHN